MNRLSIVCCLAMLTLAVASAVAAAAQPEPPSLWQRMTKPFRKTTTTISIPKGSIPRQNGKPLYTAVSNNQKSFTRSVADAVTLKPLRDKLSQSQQPKYSAARLDKQPKSTQQKSSFPSLFNKKPPEPKGPQTMNEWMAQDRPKF
ncbi:MAG TPA: hypothetical protein VHZ24_05715 [Pirellulales bacterium]|nr:hypothetical protein [Pirellulales bacterium]